MKSSKTNFFSKEECLDANYRIFDTRDDSEIAIVSIESKFQLFDILGRFKPIK